MSLSPTPSPGVDGKARRQPRMAAAERERMIVAAAIRFFADEGFDGQVRELAHRIGVKHSVLFRHFASKDALIERVYREVYLSRWRPEWETRLRDRAVPLESRLLRFYRDYTAAIFSYEWTRIFMFAGLKGVLINARYLDLVREHVLLPICEELRSDAGLPDAATHPITDAELELAWSLHGKIFYLAIRAFVYDMAVPLDDERLLRDAVHIFLKGVGPPRSSRPTTIDPSRLANHPTSHAAEKRHSLQDVAILDQASSLLAPNDPAWVAFGPADPCEAKRRRMKPDERESAIVAEAIRFFAEHGMDGQMRELAKRLGVTHPLLYRYFPTKEALIERVYEEVYLKRWNSDWETLLLDRGRSLQQRITTFYRDYFSVIDRYEWVRIFLFSGLRDVGISQRYLDRLRRRVIEPLAAELAQICCPTRFPAECLDAARATEMVWGLHGQIMYIAIRRWIYGVPVAMPAEPVIDAAITAFFDGAAAALRPLAPGIDAPHGRQ